MPSNLVVSVPNSLQSQINAIAPNPLDMGYDIILCAGQSNMTGRGVYDASVDITSGRIFQFGGSASSDARYSTIYQAQDSLSHAQAISASYFSGTWHIGPSMNFARNYATQIPRTRKVLLVPCAWGGTALVNSVWSPFGVASPGSVSPSITTSGLIQSGGLYENAISQANKAITAAKIEFPESRFVGVLWVQGESDGINNVDEATYAANLDALITGFRTRIDGAANSWFIIGQMVPECISYYSGMPAIDSAHVKTLSRLERIGLALNISGQSNNDNLHYNAVGQRVMGSRMAQQVQSAKYNIIGTKPVQVPLAPVITVTTDSAHLSWEAPKCRVIEYIVKYKLSSDSTWTNVNTGSPYRRYTVSGLTPGLSYDFKIDTVNEIGTSFYSSPIKTIVI